MRSFSLTVIGGKNNQPTNSPRRGNSSPKSPGRTFISSKVSDFSGDSPRKKTLSDASPVQSILGKSSMSLLHSPSTKSQREGKPGDSNTEMQPYIVLTYLLDDWKFDNSER